METKIISSGSITFPNEYVFAFNPNYIDFNLDSSVNSVNVSVMGNGKELNIVCSLYKGKGKCYISRMLQLLFDDDVLTTRVISATIDVSTDTEDLQSDTFNVMWGCIRLGDPFGLGEIITKFPTPFAAGMKHVRFLREVKWFKKFPFSVSFFAPSSSSILTSTIDGTSTTNVDRDTKSIFEVMPPKEAINNIFYNINIEKELLETTFPTIFDDTFSKTYKFVDESVKVTISKETEGYYIRWIDQFGFIQYWLFKKGNITHKNKLGSNTKPIQKELNGIYYGNIERVTSIDNTETHKCAAINLNENMVRTVETIIKSPYVDLFLGYNQKNEEVWLPINVVAGSYKVSPTKVLQDYEIQFTMPDTASQSL